MITPCDEDRPSQTTEGNTFSPLVVSTMPRTQRIRPNVILQKLLIIFIFVVSTLSLFRRWETTQSAGLALSLETYLDGRQREDNDATAPHINSTAFHEKILLETKKLPPRDTDTVSVEKSEFQIDARRRDDGINSVSTSDTLPAVSVTSTVTRDVSLENKKLLTRDMATVARQNDASPTRHYPEYFSKEVTLESLMERGNILTVHTGCSIVTWSYQGKRHVDRPLNDCRQHAKNGDALRAHVVTPKTAHQVEEYNSIYVPIVKLEHFVNETLPHIQNDFVLISGQNSLPPEPIPRRVYDIITEHSRVVRWFLQNLPINAYDPHHPKLAPFPYGIHPLQSAALLKEMKNNVTKDNFIYLSWFKISNNRDARQHIPIGERVEKDEYFRRMHRSSYVLSPDGDRPECHRHYEAIALGTMPITSLNPRFYSHFKGNVIFEEHRWNLTELKERLPYKSEVNQRLIFEEYWMEYVEQIVGRPMRWWDPSRDVRCRLEEISNLVKNIAVEKRPNEPITYNDDEADIKHV